MPVLLWVAFWSSLMGTAACWGEARREAPAKSAVSKQRDLSSGD